MKKSMIQFKAFTFQYDAQSEPTLKDINLEIFEGEKILIIGASGSGKSTLVKCLNGLIPQAYPGQWTGSAHVNGKELGTSSIYDFSFEAGTVLQDTDSQFVGLTVAEDIAFSLENDNVAQSTMIDLVKKWSEEVEISHLLTEKPQNLSGGQKQRVSIAGVLIDEAPVLLFDEPLASLDPAAGKESIALIDALHRQTGTTTIIIEHRLEDVLYRDIDRIILLHDGRIIADESPDMLLKSDLLSTYGIREPLYLTALKKMGVDVQTISNVSSLDTLEITETIKKQVVAWEASIEEEVERKQIEALVTLQDIHFYYPHSTRKIINGFDLTIHQGEMMSIVGKNGAGKSTICKLICGFHPINQGDILWKGQSILEESIKERAEKIGYIMQNPNQMISHNMIFDEVAFGLVKRGWSEADIQNKVEETLKICGLYSFRNWPISALSYGQKKRVTIASILVLEPDLLILDEPTAGQDYRHYTEMMKFLEELNQKGMTIVMITHDMHLMLEYTDRTIVVKEGAVFADKPSYEVLSNRELVQQSALKETSLFTLAEKVGVKDPIHFVEKFIQEERKERYYGS